MDYSSDIHHSQFDLSCRYCISLCFPVTDVSCVVITEGDRNLRKLPTAAVESGIASETTAAGFVSHNSKTIYLRCTVTDFFNQSLSQHCESRGYIVFPLLGSDHNYASLDYPGAMLRLHRL